MTDIHLIRIKDKLYSLFNGLVDMQDYESKLGSEEYSNSFLSRSYAAYSIAAMTGVDYDIAAKCITDGYHDHGVDAIYNDEIGNRLLLVQSKWHNDGNSTISLGDLLKFIDGVERIISLEFENFNKKIKLKEREIASAIKSFNYSIVLVIAYSSNQPLSSECNDVIERFLKGKNDDDEDMVCVKLVTKAETYSAMSSLSTQNKIDIDDVILNNWGPIEIGGKNCGYYGTISALMLASWSEKFGLRLFEKNIRFFKGDTDVNKGIISVLDSEPDNFYLYNNGIKIIAGKIERATAYSTDRSTMLLKLEGASIVNGAQTTGSIYEYSKKCSEKLGDVKVHIQMIELDQMNASMEERITKLSNTQNRIDNKDFATQDHEQERLRKDLAMDDIEYFYKAGAPMADNAKSCTLDDATIALGCFATDISISSTIKRAYGSIFEDLSKTPYKQIFNPSTNAFVLWNTVQLYRMVEKIEKEFQAKADRLNRLISVHGNRFLLHMVFQKMKADGIDFATSYLSEMQLDAYNILSQYNQIIDMIVEAKQLHYPDAYPANIFKNNARCKTLKEAIMQVDGTVPA